MQFPSDRQAVFGFHLNYRWVAEKFGVLIAPAIAYYLVFTYESAYCRSFGIPPAFIHPDLTTVLIYTSVVLGLGFTLALLVDAWIDSLRIPEAAQPFQHAGRLYAPFFFLLLLAVTLYGTHWRKWVFWAGLITSGTIADFVTAFFVDKQKPFLARLGGPASFLTGPGTVWDIARKRLDLEMFVFFIAIYFARVISAALGEAEALNQKTFLVASGYPDSVLVRVYGDKLICAFIDLERKRPLKNFYIANSGDAGLHFEARDIGPLVFE